MLSKKPLLKRPNRKENESRACLALTAKGLKDAAETVKDIAPAVLATAGLIANFVARLH